MASPSPATPVQPNPLPQPQAAPAFPKMNAETWRVLNEVNDQVNSSTKYRSDPSLYGKSDFWEYVNGGAGDCEDYALTKYRDLVKAGWPKDSLRLNLVQIPGGTAHAVLTADMDTGTYVLDNRFGNIKGVNDDDLQYEWLTRQVPNQQAWEITKQPTANQLSGTTEDGRHVG
jgi:predicted transglutaminase-like cysteine proteinase